MHTAHPGTIQLEGDTAVGRAYIAEFGRMRDGTSHLNYSVYHYSYQCTPDGWKVTSRRRSSQGLVAALTNRADPAPTTAKEEL